MHVHLEFDEDVLLMNDIVLLKVFDEFEEFLIDFLIQYFLVQLNYKWILTNVHFLHKFEVLVQVHFRFQL